MNRCAMNMFLWGVGAVAVVLVLAKTGGMGWLLLVTFIGIIVWVFMAIDKANDDNRANELKRAQEERANELKRAQDAQWAFIVSLVKPHCAELGLKRTQMVFPGDYGVEDRSQWDRELERFYNLIIAPALVGQVRVVQKDEILFLVDEVLVEDYLAANPQNPSFDFVDDITPVDYERLCAEKLRENGWEANTTVTTGDQGADILASKYGLRVVIQCKKYSTPVGNAAVQEVHAAKSHYKADAAVVVTNTDFTKSARALANSTDVVLLHHSQLWRLEALI